MSEERITELEVRYTLQQDQLRELSDVVLQQGRQLDVLRRELESLRSRQHEAAGVPAAPTSEPASDYEKPPHY